MNGRIFHVGMSDLYEQSETICYMKDEVLPNKSVCPIQKDYYVFPDGLCIEYHDNKYHYSSTIEDPLLYVRDFLIWNDDNIIINVADNNDLTHKMNTLPEWHRIQHMISLNNNTDITDIKQLAINYESEIHRDVQEEIFYLNKIEQIKNKNRK